MMVEVEHLSKTFKIPHERRTTVFETLTGALRQNDYEIFNVLEDVTFSVGKGECVGIIGENGSGKSTLLKVIAKIIRPSKGKVVVRGRMTPFLELGVGFQSDLTVRENVGIYASIMGLSNGMIRDRMDDIIDFAGIARFEDAKLKNLSSGMQVRLAFSTAIQTDPDILLIDEVLAVGDMEFQQKCFETFNRYKLEGVTTLFVSHDLGAIRRFCDKTLLLSQGRQIAFGDTVEIIDKYVYGREEALDRAEVEVKQEVEDPTISAGTELKSSQEYGSEADPRRWGNYKIIITNLIFMDKFGLRSSRFKSLDPMTIRIYYKVHGRVTDPVFGIGIYTAEGYHIFGTNTALNDLRFDQLEGEGHIDIEIERIPMLSGHFLLSPAIQNREYTVTYDWIDRQYSFEVVSVGREVGLFQVPCKWVV